MARDDFAKPVKTIGDSNRDAAVKQLAATPAGREYLWWLFKITQQDSNPYGGNALDTSFNCGKLDIGLQIKAHLETAAPGTFIAMMQDELNKNTEGK